MGDLIGIDDLKVEEIWGIIHRALQLKEMEKKPEVLRGKFIVTAFFEPSTRTKLSFHRAIKGLGGHVIDFVPSTSSIQKGETDIDTLLTLEAMDIDGFVVRVRRNGAPREWKQYIKVPIINGGDGTNQHPTQALLDLTTMYEHFQRLDLTVTIIGDIVHSRVANSLTQALIKVGGKVRFCGPKDFIPHNYEGVELITEDLEEALEDVDVIYTLRVQKERIEKLPKGINEFFRRYQINHKTIKLAPDHAVLMHPGPFNRNIEVSDNIVYSKKSLILNQVKNGVYSRMAVLEKVIAS